MALASSDPFDSLESWWTEYDPRGDSSMSVSGGNLNLFVPAGVDHTTNQGATFLRALQDTDDSDMVIVAKLAAVGTQPYQISGITFEDATHNNITFTIWRYPSSHVIVANTLGVAGFDSGFDSGFDTGFGGGGLSFTNHYTADIGLQAVPFWMRVTRTGDYWQLATSTNGTTWFQAAYSLVQQAITVTSVGLVAGNATGGSSPSFTAQYDRFDVVSNRKGRVAWTEIETPDATSNRKGRIGWTELETPDGAGSRKARVAWTELETPAAARKARVAWAEMETPVDTRQARIGWAALEVPSIDVDNRPPALLVQVAFSTDPWATPSWTDVSADVRSVSIRRGRSDELGTVEAGTATLTLSNESGDYDPSYTSSPYYPNVVPGRRLRVSVDLTDRGQGYEPIFDGYIVGWPQYGDHDLVTTITAEDILGRLSGISTNHSYMTEALANKPVAHWDMVYDAPETISLSGTYYTNLTELNDRSGNNHTGTYQGTWDVNSRTPAGQLTWAVGDGERAMTFNGASTRIIVPSTQALLARKSLSVALWLRAANSSETGVRYIAANLSQQSNLAWSVYLTGDTLTFNKLWGYTGDYSTLTVPSAGLIDEEWHHLVVTFDNDRGVQSAFVDGEMVGIISSPHQDIGHQLTGAANQSVMVGSYGDTPAWYVWNGQMAHISIYTTALTPGAIRRLYESRLSQFASGNGYTRTTAMVDNWLEVPADLQYVDPWLSDIPVAATTMDGASVLQQMRDWIAGEEGLVWARRDGTLMVESRSIRAAGWDWRSSSGTFGYVVGGRWDFGDDTDEYGYLNLVTSYDDSWIYNVVRVQLGDGTTVVADDTDSKDRHGTRTLQLRSDSSAAATMQGRAEWLISQYADPAVRVESLSVTGGSNTDLYETQSKLELGNHVRVTRRPRGGQTATYDALVESVAHDWSPNQWVTTLQLSPANLWDGWKLDTYSSGGPYLLGTNTRLYW